MKKSKKSDKGNLKIQISIFYNKDINLSAEHLSRNESSNKRFDIVPIGTPFRMQRYYLEFTQIKNGFFFNIFNIIINLTDRVWKDLEVILCTHNFGGFDVPEYMYNVDFNKINAVIHLFFLSF